MATALWETTFSLQNLAIAAVIEAFVITKLLKDLAPPDNPLLHLLPLTALCNVGFYCVFWGLIYPYALSPIRHFPTIDVKCSSLDFMVQYLNLSRHLELDGLIFLAQRKDHQVDISWNGRT